MKKMILLSAFLSFSAIACAPVSAERECMASLSAARNIDAAWAAPIEAEGMSNFYQISPDVYRAAQPGKGGMTSLKKLGIKTVISLRETQKDPALNEAEGTDLNLIYLPIATSKVSEQDIIAALRVIRDAPKPILIHCRHGADRTGLISAMYRIVFQGWSKACAKEELVNGGYGFHTIWTNIPKKIDEVDIEKIKAEIGDDKLVDEILNAPQHTTAEIDAQRARVATLKTKTKNERMLALADYLVKKSVWILGGDGWAYDIGYGGLDHVLASGKNIKIMVMDTEVYSNTGGQMSKATPMGAVALFAAGGKTMPKKDLGMIAMTYGNIYVAQVALGANMNQTVQALAEAEAYDGPALVICYSHCIAHGIDMSKGLLEAKKAVQSGRWILYRFNPALKAQGLNPLKVDSGEPIIPLADYLGGETRFKNLAKMNPERAAALTKIAEEEYAYKRKLYKQLAALPVEKEEVK